jgi:hypothetical protein
MGRHVLGDDPEDVGTLSGKGVETENEEDAE